MITRSFSSFFTNFAGIFSSFILAYFVDKQSINIKTRAKAAFVSRPALRHGLPLETNR